MKHAAFITARTVTADYWLHLVMQQYRYFLFLPIPIPPIPKSFDTFDTETDTSDTDTNSRYLILLEKINHRQLFQNKKLNEIIDNFNKKLKKLSPFAKKNLEIYTHFVIFFFLCRTLRYFRYRYFDTDTPIPPIPKFPILSIPIFPILRYFL